MKPYRRRKILRAAACAGLFASAVGAARVASAQAVYEPFSYSSGVSLDNQTNPGNAQPWSKMSASVSDDDILLAGSSLPYAGLAPPLGNSVSYGGAGKSERLSLGQPVTSGTMYYSLVFQVTSIGSMTTSPAFIGGFTTGSGTSGSQPQSVGTRLYIRQVGSTNTFNLGVSKNSNTDNGIDIAWDGTDAFSLNTPVLVVGSYKINGNPPGTDDEAKLWINPSAFGADAPPTTASQPMQAILSAGVAGTDLPRLDSFVLRQASGSVPNVQVDELRVDRNWAQVTPPPGTSWNGSVDSTWSNGSNWAGGVAPNAALAFVNFDQSGAPNRTVTVDVAGGVALKTANFRDANSYTINGAEPLNFSGGGSAINVFGGNHTIAAPVTMAGDLETSVAFGSTLTVSGNITTNGNGILKVGAGTLAIKNVRGSRLDVTDGRVNIIADGTAAGVSKVAALTFNTTIGSSLPNYLSTLNLSNNDIAVDYAGTSATGSWAGTGYSGLTGAIASGYNGGTWDGKGIITDQSAAVAPNSLTTVGIAEASDALGIGATDTAPWRGQLVDGTTTLIKYTYAGDANLDGVINGDDYFQIDSAFPQGLRGYFNGDFNYDGVINGDDYFLIDSNFPAQGPALGGADVPSGVAAVPEPSVIGAMALAIGFAATARQRRAANAADRTPQKNVMLRYPEASAFRGRDASEYLSMTLRLVTTRD